MAEPQTTDSPKHLGKLASGIFRKVEGKAAAVSALASTSSAVVALGALGVNALK
jgi:hypothetical protein